MDQARLPRPNTFAGLSLVLDRVAERRDEAAWIATQARSDAARYLLLDADGEAFLHPDGDALRWLDAGERERWFADAPASLAKTLEARAMRELTALHPCRPQSKQASDKDGSDGKETR